MNSARSVAITLASIAALTSVAHCTRPAPVTAEMPPPPETYSLTASTVRRTDTAAPTESAPSAESPAAAPAADGAVVADASAPAAAASAESATETGPRLAVRTALDAQHAALARCYDEILSTAPEALGRVSIELAVTSAGVISRTDVRVEGDGGLRQARPCIEAAMRAVRFTEIPAQGAVVRRSYSFVNPAVEIVVSQAMRVQAPARNARPAEQAQPSAQAARGVLTDAEVAPQLALATPALQACYATTLRRSARAAGTGELRITVQPNGEVQSTSWGATVEPIALMGDCIGTAIRAVRFRNTGTAANIRANLEFAR
ncbi:MAG: hypothetical protein U0269_29675 [Polyangiales bacterium]